MSAAGRHIFRRKFWQPAKGVPPEITPCLSNELGHRRRKSLLQSAVESQEEQSDGCRLVERVGSLPRYTACLAAGHNLFGRLPEKLPGHLLKIKIFLRTSLTSAGPSPYVNGGFLTLT